MLEKKETNNYALFNKYLGKISKITINKFGSVDNIIIFLLELCDSGYIGLAAKRLKTNAPFISPLLIYKIIRNDRYLAKCVKLAQNYATEMAEAVLYDRAINGYEEVTLDAQGECVLRKKKYCSKSLLEYLKANSTKYQNIKDDKKIKGNAELVKLVNETAVFEVEAYEADEDAEAATS